MQGREREIDTLSVGRPQLHTTKERNVERNLYLEFTLPRREMYYIERNVVQRRNKVLKWPFVFCTVQILSGLAVACLNQLLLWSDHLTCVLCRSSRVLRLPASISCCCLPWATLAASSPWRPSLQRVSRTACSVGTQAAALPSLPHLVVSVSASNVLILWIYSYA